MSGTRYEVWALGYDKNDIATDAEEFLGQFPDLNSAITHADRFKDVTYIYDADAIYDAIGNDGYLSVRVELVNNNNECEDILYENNIYIPKEV